MTMLSEVARAVLETFDNPGGLFTLRDRMDMLRSALACEPRYLPMDCPVCGRRRMEWDGKVLSCEKCATSSEWDGFTTDFYDEARRLSACKREGRQ